MDLQGFSDILQIVLSLASVQEKVNGSGNCQKN